jgi:hypothetical protein
MLYMKMFHESVGNTGSCILAIFEEESPGKVQLRSGGHQLRLRGGKPNPAGGLEDLGPDDMDDPRDNPVCPGLTLLVRIHPAEEASTDRIDLKENAGDATPIIVYRTLHVNNFLCTIVYIQCIA